MIDNCLAKNKNKTIHILNENKLSLEDCIFISSYAENNPEREDIAESYLTYLAVRYRSDRISSELKMKIESTIPNRIKYFDNKKFNMHPIQ